ncbi:MAG: hypothetical protein AAGF79_20615, partial [Pseudomonadota bacterium]
SEKLVYMPEGTYSTVAHDAPDVKIKRKELGLPDDKLVYCCFNASYRIDREVFNSWMTAPGVSVNFDKFFSSGYATHHMTKMRNRLLSIDFKSFNPFSLSGAPETEKHGSTSRQLANGA